VQYVFYNLGLQVKSMIKCKNVELCVIDMECSSELNVLTMKHLLIP